MVATNIKTERGIWIVAVVIVSVFIALAFIFTGCGDASSAVDERDREEITVHGVDTEYDGLWHSIVVDNVADGDEVLFSTLADGEYLPECPQYKYPGEYVVYCKVNRSGSEIFGGSARITIRPTILTGIGAEPVAVVFDGNEHGIALTGVEDGDSIEYSTDGENFSAVAPTFIEVGEYRVFYRVERVYGEYRASVSLVIFPDLSGVYVDLRLGAVTLTDTAAVVNGDEFAMSYDVDGRGTIGDIEFSVSGETLEFGGATYEKIGVDEQIYALSVASDKFYLRSAQPLTAEIFINGEAAVVSVDGVEITTVSDVNYCENADTENYVEHSFVKMLSAGENAIDLSKRQTRTLPREEIFHIYDGEPVDLGTGYDVILFDTASGFVEEWPQLCDVGEYEVDAVVLSSEYLPTFLKIGVTIAPNIDGVYYNDTDAVKIVGTTVWLNGDDLRAEYDETWLIAGQTVMPTDNGIDIGGESFAKRTDGYVLVVEIAERRYVFQTFEADVMVEWTSAETVVYIDATRLVETTVTDRSITANDRAVAVIHGDDVSFCIFGLTDFKSEIVIVRIGAQA